MRHAGSPHSLLSKSHFANLHCVQEEGDGPCAGYAGETNIHTQHAIEHVLDFCRLPSVGRLCLLPLALQCNDVEETQEAPCAVGDTTTPPRRDTNVSSKGVSVCAPPCALARACVVTGALFLSHRPVLIRSHAVRPRLVQFCTALGSKQTGGVTWQETIVQRESTPKQTTRGASTCISPGVMIGDATTPALQHVPHRKMAMARE